MHERGSRTRGPGDDLPHKNSAEPPISSLHLASINVDEGAVNKLERVLEVWRSVV